VSDIIERAEAALEVFPGVPVFRELVAELKAARAEIIRLTPNEAGYAGRD
jgi:hypothetical protein